MPTPPAPPTPPSPRRVVLILGRGPAGLDDAVRLLGELPPIATPVVVAISDVARADLERLADVAPARWARDDAPVGPGLWICPADHHTIVRDGRFVVTDAGSAIVAPSTDKLLYTARSEFRSRITAIVSGDDIADSPCLRLVSLRGGSVHLLPPAGAADAACRRREIAASVAAAHPVGAEAISA